MSALRLILATLGVLFWAVIGVGLFAGAMGWDVSRSPYVAAFFEEAAVFPNWLRAVWGASIAAGVIGSLAMLGRSVFAGHALCIAFVLAVAGVGSDFVGRGYDASQQELFVWGAILGLAVLFAAIGYLNSGRGRTRNSVSSTRERSSTTAEAGAAAPHVFISYSSKHRALTERLAAYLKTKGLTVWWDQQALEARGPFDGQIRAGLQAADVVIVIWTTDAIVSDWVNFEADYAFKNNKLINVEPKGVNRERLPERFRDHHRHVQSDARPIDFEKIFSEYLAVRDGRRLPKEVPERDQYERDYDELLLDTKRLMPLADLSVSPSTVLQAKYAFVPYDDVHGFKAGIVDWAEGRGEETRTRASAGYLIHGAGGTGKTRLLIEVAAELRERGWSAGFLNPHAPADSADKRKRRAAALRQLIEVGADKGLMVILDYAEDRRADVISIAQQMAEAGHRDAARPRVLVLLTREIGEWWDNLKSEEPLLESLFSAGRLGSTQELSLRCVRPPEARLALFKRAIEAFSATLAGAFELNTDPPREKQLARLTGNEQFDRPLAILMAALLHVCADADADNDATIAVLLDQVLRLERNHWIKVLREIDNAGRQQLASGTVQVTMVGGTPEREATASLLAGDPAYAVPVSRREHADGAVAKTIARLSRFYGNGRGGLIALEPDLVGEHAVVSEAARDFGHTRQLVDACLALATTEYRQVLTVLNRASMVEHGSKSELAEALLDHLVREGAVELAPTLIAVALAEPEGKLPEAMIAAAGDLDERALSALGGALPDQTIRLLDVALTIAQRLVELRKESLVTAERSGSPTKEIDAVRSDAAHALNGLSVSFANLGRHEEALDTAEEAVALCRVLDAKDSVKFRRVLVTCLNSLAAALNALHRPTEALRILQEVIQLNRTMVGNGVSEFVPSLAMSLANFGTFLSQIGHHVDALAISQEAVDLYRKLAHEKPEEFAFELGGSLINLSASLADVEKHDEALLLAKEAVALYGEKARDKPDEFVPSLAKATGSLGMRHLAVGDTSAALRVSLEASAIYRDLAAARPREFLPGLAHSLKECGVMFLSSGRKEESLSALEESCVFYADLARQRPDDFLPELALGLGARSDTLSALGKFAEAAESAREGLAAVATVLPKYPEALSKRAGMLGGVYMEACKRAGIGADGGLLQHVAHLIGAELPPQLVLTPDSKLVFAVKSDEPPAIDWSLATLAAQHFDEGRLVEAEALYRDLLETCRREFGQHPHTATIASNLAQLLETAGRRDEAVCLARESLAIFKACFDQFDPNVASQEANLASILADGDEPDEAKTLYLSAIRSLEADDSTDNQTRLAVALGGFARLLRSKGNLVEAENVSRRHLDILIDSSKRNRRPDPYLSRAFQSYGGLLSEMGRSREEIVALLNELGSPVGMAVQTNGST
ncbi:MAG: tetratricopeptide repeat protein [Gammaproteobacteria bacterium]